MPNANLLRARAFLACHRIALVGTSRDAKDFSRSVMNALVARGYDVLPVNPAGGEIADRVAFATVGEIVPAPEAALFMTPSSRTADAVADCLRAGVRKLWFHRGGGTGAVSPEALARCLADGVEPVTDLCPFMVLSDVGWFHRAHAYFRARQRRSA